MASYIPYIGSKGRFKFKEPFNTVLKDNKIYTVASIRTFDNLTDTGIDPFEMVYKPVGLTEEDYNKDYVNGKVVVLELMDEEGKYYSVPSSYILSVPNINGVLYRDKMLVVDLGYLPDNYDFTEYKQNIKDLTKMILGVDKDVNIIDASPTIMLTTEQHKLNEKERLTVMQSEDNIYVKYKQCKDKINQASNIIKGLEKALDELNNR